jgi:hypothetical protein
MLLIIYAIATENFCVGAKNGPGLASLGAATAIETINNIQWFICVLRAVSWRRLLFPSAFFVMTAGADLPYQRSDMRHGCETHRPAARQ